MKDIFRRQPRGGATAPESDQLWVRCTRCKELLYAREHEQALKVCTKCKYHFPVTARERIDMTLDAGTFQEYDRRMHSSDPLNFENLGERYATKLRGYAEQAQEEEAFLYGSGQIDGQPVVIGVTEFRFCGGSMGAVFGEKVTRAIELAVRQRAPLVLISSSGGARMQEGVVSLLQMAKVVAALDRLKEAGLPFFSIMVDPCLGGVTASYAMLGDVNLAEPGAYIGFAGRRVIEQTMHQKLPQDAATAEFLLQHGMVDVVAQRQEIPGLLARLIRMYVANNTALTTGLKERGLVEQPA